MGFKLKKFISNPLTALNPVTGVIDNLSGGKISGGLGIGGPKPAGPGPDFGFTDPNSVAPPPTSLANPQRRSLSDVLGDQSFNYTNGPVGPSIEDDSAAYDNFLKSGEAARQRDEQRAFDNVLNGLQGRGLVQSGITLHDVADQVIGPAAERAQSLAAQFGLEQAKNRSTLLENERNRAQALNQAKLGGRLQAILADQGDLANLDSQNLKALQDFQMAKLGQANAERSASLADQVQQRRDMEARRRQRQGGLLGLLGGAAGGILGGPSGAYVGSQVGQNLG
jgi:hypothetical protein